MTREKPYSTDRNLLHISYEGGILEDPWREPYDDMFLLTVVAREGAGHSRSTSRSTSRPATRCAVNGERALARRRCWRRLNEIGGRHGVGRVDLVENRYVGMKSRGVYETPGGTILHAAHRAVESLTLDREVMHLRDSLDPALRRDGLLRLLVRARAPHAAGRDRRVAAHRHRHGAAQALQGQRHRRRPQVGALALRSRDRHASRTTGVYRQADAEGFIRLNALRLRIRAMVEKANS